MKKIFLYSWFILAIVSTTNAKNQLIFSDSLTLPKVFLMGDYSKSYEKLQTMHPTSLMTVCNNDLDITFDKWADFLIDMENYAETINYDLKGIKMWIEVFWDKDGALKHITYGLKPQSKNVETRELSGFMMSYMNHYKIKFVPNKKIFHNSHAQFPLATRPAGNVSNR